VVGFSIYPSASEFALRLLRSALLLGAMQLYRFGFAVGALEVRIGESCRTKILTAPHPRWG
jgi:hypothetical protein